jgi:hypothetical protein
MDCQNKFLSIFGIKQELCQKRSKLLLKTHKFLAVSLDFFCVHLNMVATRNQTPHAQLVQRFLTDGVSIPSNAIIGDAQGDGNTMDGERFPSCQPCQFQKLLYRWGALPIAFAHVNHPHAS